MTFDYTSILLTAVEYLCILMIFITGDLLPLSFIAIVILVLAIFLGLWSLWTIFIKKFRITNKISSDSRIVAKGPYKFIRHPLYSSLLLILLTIVLNHFSFIRLILWLILLTVMFAKLMYEERSIIKRNTDYLIYKRGTKRLLPFIY